MAKVCDFKEIFFFHAFTPMDPKGSLTPTYSITSQNPFLLAPWRINRPLFFKAARILSTCLCVRPNVLASVLAVSLPTVLFQEQKNFFFIYTDIYTDICTDICTGILATSLSHILCVDDLIQCIPNNPEHKRYKSS